MVFDSSGNESGCGNSKITEGKSHRNWIWLRIAGPVLFVVANLVPNWAILLTWACLAELAAVLIDIWEWRQSRDPRRRIRDTTLKTRDGKFTWQEVRRHNTAESLWVAVDGKVYDVTNFLESHPGGKEFLLLGAGRDLTDLLQCYHPFTDKPKKVLQKYLIGELTSFEHPRFRPDSGFYRECRERVKEYFDRTGLDPKHPASALWRMSLVYIVAFGTFFFTLLCIRPELLALRILATVISGIFQAIPLTHWMHDASHGAIGHSERWWWYCGRLSLDWLSGSSMVVWQNQHVIGHHVYTNVLGSDPDLKVHKPDDTGILRFTPRQMWKKLYSYQHIYMPPLYGLLGMRARFEDIAMVFISGLCGPIHINPISSQDALRQVASKSFWIFSRFVFPYYFLGLKPMQYIPFILLSDIVSSYWLAFNFVVSHISPEAEYYDGSTDKVIDEEWAKLQVKTSVDYAHGSVWDTFFTGGLNYQTTHHLMPAISQYHYPQIAPIIQEVCKKHGLTYNVLPSFMAGVKKHVLHLKNMGEEGKCAPFKLE